MTRPARLTEMDIRRAIRAAQKEGARLKIVLTETGKVEIEVNGKEEPIEPHREVVF